MPWWAAFPASLALLYLADALEAVIQFPVSLIMIPGTALWAAIDSEKIGLQKHESVISYDPYKLFVGITLLWLIGFPWYLMVRHRILSRNKELSGGL